MTGNRDALRKTLFVLPNLFALGGAFSGFYAMLLANQGDRAWNFWAAAALIGFAVVLKGVDSRISRLTRTQTAFSVELDSLSDGVAFGVAPAWLVYQWGLAEIGWGGVVIAFAYVAAVALRLARFDFAKDEVRRPRFFKGLPATAGATVLAAMVAVHTSYLGQVHPSADAWWSIAIVVLSLALLHVTSLQFRSLYHLDRGAILLVAVLITAVALTATTTSIELGVLVGITGYVAFHLAFALIRRIFHRGHGEIAQQNVTPADNGVTVVKDPV